MFRLCLNAIKNLYVFNLYQLLFSAVLSWVKSTCRSHASVLQEHESSYVFKAEVCDKTRSSSKQHSFSVETQFIIAEVQAAHSLIDREQVLDEETLRKVDQIMNGNVAVVEETGNEVIDIMNERNKQKTGNEVEINHE